MRIEDVHNVFHVTCSMWSLRKTQRFNVMGKHMLLPTVDLYELWCLSLYHLVVGAYW